MARSFSMKLCNFRAFTFNVGTPLRTGPLTFVLFQRFLIPRYGMVLFTLQLWAFLENVFSQPIRRRLLRHLLKKGHEKKNSFLAWNATILCNFVSGWYHWKCRIREFYAIMKTTVWLSRIIHTSTYRLYKCVNA